jgi:hypothetical protein
MHKLYSVILLLLLSACGGPLSMVSYILASGVAMHANDEAYRDGQNELYTDRCLPTHRPENPMINASHKVELKDPVAAYGFYMIAERLQYPQAKQFKDSLYQRMPVKQRLEATKIAAKYSDIHISSCFYPPSEAYRY